MTYDSVKQRIWRNALSNCLRTFVCIAVMLVTFRLLYQVLPRAAPLLFPGFQIENTWLRILVIGGPGGLASLICVSLCALTISGRQALRPRFPASFKKGSPSFQIA